MHGGVHVHLVKLKLLGGRLIDRLVRIIECGGFFLWSVVQSKQMSSISLEPDIVCALACRPGGGWDVKDPDLPDFYGKDCSPDLSNIIDCVCPIGSSQYPVGPVVPATHQKFNVNSLNIVSVDISGVTGQYTFKGCADDNKYYFERV